MLGILSEYGFERQAIRVTERPEGMDMQAPRFGTDIALVRRFLRHLVVSSSHMDDKRQSALDSFTPEQKKEIDGLMARARELENELNLTKKELERAQAKTEETEKRAKEELERAQAKTEEIEKLAKEELNLINKELELTRGRLDNANNLRKSDTQEIDKKDREINELKKELKGLDLILLALKILRQPVNMLRLNCSNQARLCRW